MDIFLDEMGHPYAKYSDSIIVKVVECCGMMGRNCDFHVLDVNSTPYKEFPGNQASITFSFSPPAIVKKIVVYPHTDPHRSEPAEGSFFTGECTATFTLDCSLSSPTVSHCSTIENTPLSSPIFFLSDADQFKYPCTSLAMDFSIYITTRRPGYNHPAKKINQIKGIGFVFYNPDPKLIEAAPLMLPTRLQDLSKSLWKDSSFADVSIEAGDQIFKVHKAILANSSPVFHAMFAAQTAESLDSTVRLGESTSAGAVLFLEYLYTRDPLQVLPANADCAVVIELFELSEMYQVLDLIDLCVSWMSNEMNVSTVINILRAAHVHDIVELQKKCTTFIQDECTSLFCSKQEIHKWFEFTTERPELFNLLAEHFAEESEEAGALRSKREGHTRSALRGGRGRRADGSGGGMQKIRQKCALELELKPGIP
jgi:hypothetical protein